LNPKIVNRLSDLLPRWFETQVSSAAAIPRVRPVMSFHLQSNVDILIELLPVCIPLGNQVPIISWPLAAVWDPEQKIESDDGKHYHNNDLQHKACCVEYLFAVNLRWIICRSRVYRCEQAYDGSSGKQCRGKKKDDDFGPEASKSELLDWRWIWNDSCGRDEENRKDREESVVGNAEEQQSPSDVENSGVQREEADGEENDIIDYHDRDRKEDYKKEVVDSWIPTKAWMDSSNNPLGKD